MPVITNILDLAAVAVLLSLEECLMIIYPLIVMCAVLAFFFLRQESKGNYVAAVILKGLASLCFVGIGLKTRTVMMDATASKTASLIVCGLIIGCMADVLLNLRMVFQKKGQAIFLVGILVFLSGHILYLAAIMPMNSHKLICIAAAIVLTALIMIWIFKKITAKTAFKVFGVVYIGAIVLLNCVAAVNLLQAYTFFTAAFAAGAVLFLVSDIVLILNTFGTEFRQSLRNTNIGLYYAGQILIALSMLGLRYRV